MKRFVYFAALVMLLACGMIGTQAQTATPTPLSPGDSKRGVLSKLGDSITIRFSVPVQEDMIIHYSADKLVFVTVCVEVNSPPICPPPGGGGDGDPPSNGTIYLPSRDTAQTFDVSLYRPTDGAVNYQLKTYGIIPSGLGLDETRTITETTAAAPYQSYIINVNPDQPFVIEIEDAQASGDFLWVAHEPFLHTAFSQTVDRQTFPTRIDAAGRDDNPKGVSSLELYYLGGTEFRVLVTAQGALVLHSSMLNVPLLDAGVSLPLTLSYRNPVGIVRLNAEAGDVAKVDFQIPDESRAVAEVYQEGGEIGDSLELGYNSNQRAAAPIAGTIHEVATERPVYALVQLGDGSTRDPLRVTLGWTKEP